MLNFTNFLSSRVGALSLSFAYKDLPPLVYTKGLTFLCFFDDNSSWIMADDVINILENMKLTTEKEEIIFVLDEGRKEKIESCSQSLIGKFLMCRSFNKRAAQGTLKRTWGLENQVQVVEVGPNLFQFKFNSEFDMAKVLRGGPWTLTIRFYC